ncbi:MAG: hypothetical protein Q4D85_06920 [Corynebacterium sp.]|uniref:hypothetical protein n=1 Tax=Corynebacterium sp. TaxID=1720 RepID=UPI0026DC0C6D|nr:hypothetical protein [Corynebacterium sp.]MDO5098478.1 hypothetical protein [Corynebacterium sp.]
MKSLRFFLVLLMIWLGTQIIVWGFSEIVLQGSNLERSLKLEDMELYIKVLVYTLFPLPLTVVLARRLVEKK